MAIGYNVRKSDNKMLVENYKIDRYLYPENYDCYSIDEIDDYVEYQNTDVSIDYEPVESTKPLDGPPMDSPWPMYCHDVRHTGRSPYSTADNPGTLKWRFECDWSVEGSAAIDDNRVIYFGSQDGYFYALHQNGTLKWKYNVGKGMECGPALDEEGTIYIGTRYSSYGNYLYAINPNGTLKWKYKTGDIFSSPAIGDDGTIYFCESDNWRITALYPNGTLRWRYKTNYVIYSSPAIGNDGTVFCGSHDTYLYALYPNNGTLKWKYKTGHWIRVSPCIADDGTIYVVSLDNYLHAVYPNGTLKWKTNVGAGTSPTIGQDGTIYAGYKKLFAINPNNGSIKWIFDPGPDRTIRGGTPCNSAEGIIYFGTSDGEEIISVNPDGTERWRCGIGTVEFAPVIDEEGNIYIGTSHNNVGYLHAFGKLDSDAPSAPDIDGPTKGKPGIEYNYTFVTTDPDGDDVCYYIDWYSTGDGFWTDWYASGEEVILPYTWPKCGTFTISAKAKDIFDAESNWTYFDVEIPRNKATTSSLFQWFLEMFPLLSRLLNLR